jgi:hypothetical protein
MRVAARSGLCSLDGAAACARGGRLHGSAITSRTTNHTHQPNTHPVADLHCRSALLLVCARLLSSTADRRATVAATCLQPLYREESMTVPKRFGVLRFIAALLRVIAWVILILAIVVGVAVGLSSFADFLSTESIVGIPIVGPFLNLMGAGAGGVIAGIGAALSGLLFFVFWYALAESISMQLAIEENTRLTAALLLRMHQESQPDPRAAAGYGATYASEPFES